MLFNSDLDLLKEYIINSSRKNQIWLGLMNEPNEVNTRDVGKAYGKVINVIRKMKIENTLLVEGNYWAGLHAQMTPKGDNNGKITRPSAESEGWAYEEDVSIPPAQIILDEITKLELFLKIRSSVFNLSVIKVL